MSIHTKTRMILEDNLNKFENPLSESIQKLLKLIDQHSPLSDIKMVLEKSGIELDGIEFYQEENSWMPFRNVMRILGKVAAQEYDSDISSVMIHSMNCGCDYFEGTVKIKLADSKEVDGKYRWQWTAFAERERSYQQFTEFPEITV